MRADWELKKALNKTFPSWIVLRKKHMKKHRGIPQHNVSVNSYEKKKRDCQYAS